MFGRNKEKFSGHVDTLIAEAAKITGDVEFAGGLHLDGRISGNVKSAANSKGTLWISEKGQVEGNIEAPNVVLNGLVRGDVLAREKIVLGANARITGNVSYGLMEMAQGAQVSGKLLPLTPAAAIAATSTANAAAQVAVPLNVLPGSFDGRRSAT